MRICEICKAAQNPLSSLRFSDLPSGGALCANCYKEREIEHISGLDDYVVVTCPNCRGSGIHGNKACSACIRLGVVRINRNSIPVYRQK